MSLDTNARTEAVTPVPAVADTAADQATTTKWFLRGRWLFTMWVILSVAWGAAVGFDLYSRITMQADMSRDVEADLDQGYVPANCVGAQCAGASERASRLQDWSGIASTYLRFGSDEMAEYTLGPPAAVLLIGLSVMFVLRRRRTAGSRTRT